MRAGRWVSQWDVWIASIVEEGKRETMSVGWRRHEDKPREYHTVKGTSSPYAVLGTLNGIHGRNKKGYREMFVPGSACSQ